MFRPTEIRRVIVVVLDGLRPDAIRAFDLARLRRLAGSGASTMHARTISPSITWSALTSLLTGVEPAVHGVLADSMHLPRPKTEIIPLPELLLRGGLPSSAFLGELPVFYRVFASRIAERLGFTHTRFSGATAHDVLMAARSKLRTQREGLIFLHLTDADRAGHQHGWMSPQYGEAARRLDAALGQIASDIDIEYDPETLLIALADHGGGGVVPDHHEGEHPLNATVPLVLAGASVVSCSLGEASLLDVPATIAWTLGIQHPDSYSGRVLLEAFDAEERGDRRSYRTLNERTAAGGRG